MWDHPLMSTNNRAPTGAVPIRTGVIGYGLSGKVFHTPFIEANPHFSLDFIATSNNQRAAQAQEDHPHAAIVANADELLAHSDRLDLVVLATPPHTHLKDGLAALDAGLAVIVDKPFAVSASEGLQLIEKAEEERRPLIVFQNRRWDGDFLTVEKIVRVGSLGRVYQFESSFEQWAPEVGDRWQDTTPPSLGGGVTFDLGSHLVDQAIVLFGPVAHVHADLRTVRDGSNDDVSFVELVHESGVRSHLWMNRLAAQPRARFRLHGTQASYVSYGLDGQEAALAAGVKPTDDAYGIESESTWGKLGVVGAGHPVPTAVATERGNYPHFYEATADAVRGSDSLPVNPHDALEVVKVIERIHQAAGVK